MKHLSRSPLLWIGATILSGLLYFFAFHFFPKTFPLIHLDITMDLKHALTRANEIAKKNNFGPIDHHNAAMFHTDTTVKTFVELEAGGKDAFVAMMEKNLYMPYTWRVRHFKEHEKNETTIAFMPDGTPYSFIETISENIPGEQLPEAEARTIAELNATQHWNIDFNHYSLVEASQKTQPSKRIDHTFVYERTNTTIGEGFYRLKIVVSGNKTTEVSPFVKVPESFTRRYAEMRSANNTIALAASLMMALLYLIGGCGFGMYWIVKKRLAIFKQPFLWGIFLASINTLVSINQLPFLWMQYNNAHSLHGFLIQLFLSFFISLIAQIAFLTIIITTAETLTRRAFGNHPQLWLLHTAENSASYAVLGRTVGGYLMVGFSCAFVIAFYLLSSRYLNWWTPSEMLFDPNVLATYAPWFSPLAQSLNAGFMEECLFRAIPLAGAALLGTYFGKRNWWISCAFILQAVVFGAAHANYPTQPSYARLIELLIPSFIWGLTYLRWGLLPTIIAHCVYDIIWFSLPIFASHTPQARMYKIIIIFVTLLPLFYALYARIRRGFWSELPQSHRNETWEPSALVEQPLTPATPQTPSLFLSLRKQKLLLSFGLLGLIAWICTTPFTHNGITITVDRTNAIKQANAFLESTNTVLNTPWKTLPLIFSHYKLVPHIASQHKFIWRDGNKELYHSLLGTYLEPAHWTIRYAQFDTDIVQRAEEYKVLLYNDTIYRYQHQLPEIAAGANLNQIEAHAIAHTVLQKQFNLNPTHLIEISAEQTQLPQRRNWIFIFSNPSIYPLPTGQARISIEIAGDVVVNTARTIHVPEEWLRTEQHEQSMLNIVSMIFLLIVLFFLLLGALLLFRQKKDYIFSKKLFFTLFGLLTILGIADCINSWQTILGSFNTTAPLANQTFQLVSLLFISFLMKSALCALAITFIAGQNRLQKLTKNLLTLSLGISVGLLAAGMISIAQKLIPTNLPLWPQYDSLGGSLSLVTSILGCITYYVQTTMAFSLLFLIVDMASKQYLMHRILLVIASALVGMSIIELPSIESLPAWIIVGTSIGLVLLALYRYIIRYDYSLIPLAIGSFIIMKIMQQGLFNAYPGALLEAVISIAVVGALSALWYWYMNRDI